MKNYWLNEQKEEKYSDTEFQFDLEFMDFILNDFRTETKLFMVSTPHDSELSFYFSSFFTPSFTIFESSTYENFEQAEGLSYCETTDCGGGVESISE